MDGTTTDETSTVGGGEESYLTVILAVSIPCGLVILALVIVIVVILFLTVRSSSSDIDEVEATYMRRRFQGLSLEEQRRLAAVQKQKRKKSEHFKISTRRSSSATDSSKSSVKLTPYSKRAKIRQANPFELQEWQLKMSGIDISPTRETNLDDESFTGNPIGALNPLMLEDDTTADYEPAQKSKSADEGESSSEEGSSSDSMNPYDN